MNYPADKYQDDLADAGFQLIQFLKDNSLDIPVIICSSFRYVEKDSYVIGTVHYAEKTDLRQEFGEKSTILDALRDAVNPLTGRP